MHTFRKFKRVPMPPKRGSMKVTVKFAPYISVLTKTDHITIDLDENARLSDLLKVLTMRYGEALMDLLYTSELSPLDVWASVMVESQVVPLPLIPESDVKLKEGSVVVLMAPVSGG